MDTVQRQGTAPIGRLLLQYSLPAVAGFLANALYQFVDRMMVGRGVGTAGMAAVTSAYPITMLAMGVGLLLGTGTGSLISTSLGQGRKDEAEKVLGQSLRLGILLGVGLAVLLCVFAAPVVQACGASGPVLDAAVGYLRITAVGQVFLIAIISMGNILRVQGRPGLGLFFMVFGNVLNVIFCALGIFVFKLGVNGAAYATAIAIGINFVAIVAFVQSRHSILQIRREYLQFNREISRAIVKLGAPVFLMQAFGTLVLLAANHGAKDIGGTRGIAMIGVFNAIYILLIYPPLGIAQAMQPLLAYNRGAKRFDRVLGILRLSLVATTTLGVTSAIVVASFPGPIAALFTRTDVELVDMVTRGIPWFMLSIASFGIQGTASHYFLATQKPGRAATLLLGRQLLAIPLFFVMPKLFGVRGLYGVSPLADLPVAVLAAVYLRKEWHLLRDAARAQLTPAAPTLTNTGDAVASEDEQCAGDLA
jgi:putative MATE family efflux protein